jgi:uncharacterized protein
MTIQSQLQDLRNEITKIASSHGAATISVFGSVVREEDNPSSDIDFLVNFEEGRTLFDLIRLKQDLEILLGRPVDVVSVNALHPRIRNQVLNQAVQL